MSDQDTKFGTSETVVFGAGGSPLKIIAEIADICPACPDSPRGPTRYGIIREDARTTTLICPTCGDQKTVFTNTVKKIGVSTP